MESEFEFPLKLVRAKRKQRIGRAAFSHATRATHATPVKRNLGFVGAILGRCTTGNRIKRRCASFGWLVDGREVSWHLPHRWDAASLASSLLKRKRRLRARWKNKLTPFDRGEKETRARWPVWRPCMASRVPARSFLLWTSCRVRRERQVGCLLTRAVRFVSTKGVDENFLDFRLLTRFLHRSQWFLSIYIYLSVKKISNDKLWITSQAWQMHGSVLF